MWCLDDYVFFGFSPKLLTCRLLKDEKAHKRTTGFLTCGHFNTHPYSTSIKMVSTYVLLTPSQGNGPANVFNSQQPQVDKEPTSSVVTMLRPRLKRNHKPQLPRDLLGLGDPPLLFSSCTPTRHRD